METEFKKLLNTTIEAARLWLETLIDSRESKYLSTAQMIYDRLLLVQGSLDWDEYKDNPEMISDLGKLFDFPLCDDEEGSEFGRLRVLRAKTLVWCAELVEKRASAGTGAVSDSLVKLSLQYRRAKVERALCIHSMLCTQRYRERELKAS